MLKLCILKVANSMKSTALKEMNRISLKYQTLFFFFNLAPSLYRGIGNNTKDRYNNKFLGPPYSPKLVSPFFLQLSPPTMYLSLSWLILHLT